MVGFPAECSSGLDNLIARVCPARLAEFTAPGNAAATSRRIGPLFYPDDSLSRRTAGRVGFPGAVSGLSDCSFYRHERRSRPSHSPHTCDPDTVAAFTVKFGETGEPWQPSPRHRRRARRCSVVKPGRRQASHAGFRRATLRRGRPRSKRPPPA